MLASAAAYSGEKRFPPFGELFFRTSPTRGELRLLKGCYGIVLLEDLTKVLGNVTWSQISDTRVTRILICPPARLSYVDS
jgi:hypothetical protein